MNKLTLFGTAALVAAALAAPAAAKHHMHHAAAAAADAAAGAAAAPMGMATAYNSDYGAGWNGGRWDHGYSTRNGMSCTPGTWIKGDDGRRHPCQ